MDDATRMAKYYKALSQHFDDVDLRRSPTVDIREVMIMHHKKKKKKKTYINFDARDFDMFIKNPQY